MILSLLHQDFTAKAWKTLEKTKNCSISWDHTGEDALLNLKRLLEETTHGGLSPAKLAIAAFNASDPSQAGAPHAGFMMATDPAVNLSHAEQNTPGQERIISVEHQVAQLQDPIYAEPLGRELRDPPWDEELMPGPSHFPYRYEPISDYQQFLYPDEPTCDQQYLPRGVQEMSNTNQLTYNEGWEQYQAGPQIDTVPNPNENVNDDPLIPIVNDANGEISKFRLDLRLTRRCCGS